MKEKILELWQNLISKVLYLIVIVVLFSGGYYFGYKNGYSYQFGLKQQVESSVNLNEKASRDLDNINRPSPLNLERVSDVHFLKPNVPKTCPLTHQIKGVFNSDYGYFYEKTNKSFERVKPDICFIDVETARDKAGFIQKF